MLIKKQGQVIGLQNETRREADLWAALSPSLCLAPCAQWSVPWHPLSRGDLGDPQLFTGRTQKSLRRW